MSEEREVRALSAAAYAGMFVFGIVMALVGATLPALAARLQFQVADIGKLFLAMNAAMLVTSLALGLAMDRFGMKAPLVLGPALVAAALVVVARANVLGDLTMAVLLLGVGGALNGATNTLVADLHDEPRRKGAALNRLGIFFGFGALLLPFSMGALLARLSVGTLLLAAAALSAVVGMFASALRFPAPKQRHALPVADMPRFLRSPLVLAFAFLLFFESGVEFTLGGFISTYLIHDMAVASVSAASWVLAGYWAAIMASRAVLSRLALGTDPYWTLLFCAVGACAGSLLAGMAPSPAVATVGIVVCGFSLAGIFPTALTAGGAGIHVFGVWLPERNPLNSEKRRIRRENSTLQLWTGRRAGWREACPVRTACARPATSA